MKTGHRIVTIKLERTFPELQWLGKLFSYLWSKRYLPSEEVLSLKPEKKKDLCVNMMERKNSQFLCLFPLSRNERHFSRKKERKKNTKNKI